MVNAALHAASQLCAVGSMLGSKAGSLQYSSVLAAAFRRAEFGMIRQTYSTEHAALGSSSSRSADDTCRAELDASASGAHPVHKMNEDPSGLAAASTTADAALESDDVCHPADPYCQAGEEPPRPDDFHDDGDGSTPPSSGFPA